MSKIFVQIPAYRDPECKHTLNDIFRKAKNPENLKIAVCWQYIPGEDDYMMEVDSKYKDQVILDLVDARESNGVCWARNRLQKFYSGEEYTLMIDSHMRFVENWDEKLIEELKKCPSQKPVLSNHPASYTPPDNIDKNARPTILRVKPFNKFGDIRVTGDLLNEFPEKPLPGAFIAAGYIFTLGKVINEIPYDPYIYFEQEEICLSARLWTSGWDIFSPSKIFIYHYYMNKADKSRRSLHWEDHKDWGPKGLISRKRYMHLFGIKESDDKDAIVDLDKYGFGKTRTLKQYEEYSGINFKTFEATNKAFSFGFIPDLSKYISAPFSTNFINEKPDWYSGGNNSAAKKEEKVIVKPEEIKVKEFNTDENAINNFSLFNTNLFSEDGNCIHDPKKKLGFKMIKEGVPEGIMVLENYLPADICKKLCEYSDQVIGRKLHVLDNDKSTKDKVVTMESSGRITEYVAIDAVSGEMLSMFIDIYVRRLAPYYNVQFEWFERPQILRYLPGGKYNRHADSEHIDKETKQWVKAQDRDLSVLLYLNEEYEGGMISFPPFNYKIKPKTGMLVAFPSDHRYLHEAEPTTSGKRYVVVSWASVIGSKRCKTSMPYASVMLNLPKYK